MYTIINIYIQACLVLNFLRKKLVTIKLLKLYVYLNNKMLFCELMGYDDCNYCRKK